MIGMGTIVNAAAVAVGACIGLLLKKGIRQDIQASINKALGIAVLVIGLNGVIKYMFTVGEDGSLSDHGSMLLLVSLVAGTLLGEMLRIDDRLGGIGGLIERKFHLQGVSKGMIDACLVFCVGAMSIIGAFNDGLRGEPQVLYLKAALDFVGAVVMASTMGIGVLFSAVPLVLYQGSLTLLAGVLEPVLSGQMLSDVCMVGYAMVMCIGINFLGDVKIKTANMLPALLVPVVYNLTMLLKTL